MEADTAERGIDPEDGLSSERAMLVRLCTHLTGDPQVAEDLAQETLLTACRIEHQLREPEKRSQWLSGIARNLSLHWRRRQGLELARVGRPHSKAGDEPQGMDGWLPDGFDLEVEIERHELAELLDGAMGLLPPDTRDLLVERYINESPHADVAARLGLTEDAVTKRVERGKLALRRVLTTEFSAEAATYGLRRTGDGWQETRIWCPTCGQRRVIGRFDREKPEFTLRCPDCYREHGGNYACTASTECLTGVKGYKPALSRLITMATRYFRQALVEGAAPCVACGQLAPLLMGRPSHFPPAIRSMPGAHVKCAGCGTTCDQSLHGLVLGLPEGRLFTGENPRIRTLPDDEVEADGRMVIVTSFESVTGSARLDVLSARETFEVMGVYGDCVR